MASACTAAAARGRRAPARWLLALALLLAACAASAQEFTAASGDYVVHYNAMPSVQLLPEVARAARVRRSPNRALLTIAVQRRSADGSSQPVAATIQAAGTNLAGQRRAVPMRQVRDGDAIYYLGEHGVDHLETIDYVLEVLPADAARPIDVRFRQQFFTR